MTNAPRSPRPERASVARRQSANYGNVARVYQALEYIAFGRALERTRTAFVDSLRDCSEIAVFGAGDGRCFRRLLASAPRAHFVSVEADPEMTRLSRTVVAALGAASRIEFIQADARQVQFPAGRFDAVVTQFFLDCFTAEDLDRLIPAIAMTLRPGSPWLLSDFAIPASPLLARWRARAWIAVLCAFFRWQAGHALATLPPMEPLLRAHGFRCEKERALNLGLLRATVYRK